MDPQVHLRSALAALSALTTCPHIDDAADSLVADVGWDAAFLSFAALPEDPRAAAALYSLVCDLLLRSGASGFGAWEENVGQRNDQESR